MREPLSDLLRLVLVGILTAAPAVLAADSVSLTDGERHAAYCAGFHQAQEMALGDECFDAKAGWENTCSADTRQESRWLAELTAEQSLYKAGVGDAIVSGQNAYKQCISEAASDAGLAQASECRKHYTGQQLTACMESGPAAPTCERLRACDE
jgi:hypothetical protein